MSDRTSLWAELKRRRVYRTGVGYLAGAFVLWQVAEILVPNLGLPDSLLRAVIIATLLGFPVALALSWAFDVVPGDQVNDGEDRGPGEHRISRSRAIGVGITAGLVTVLGLALWLGSSPRGSTHSGEDGSSVAVVPFEARGSEDVELLAEGIVDLLHMGLDGVGGIHVVEPRRSIGAWSGLADPTASDEAIGRAVARATGSALSITGRIVQAGDDLRISAAVRDAEGSVLTTRQIDGPRDGVLALVDRLSVAVLADILPGEVVADVDVAALASTSVQAVGAYLAGMRDFRRGRFDEAVASLEEAVAADSTFALAYVGLADAYGWSGRHGSPIQLEAYGAAGRHAERLPRRQARLARAYELLGAGNTAVLDSLRSFLADYPTEVRAWYALGDFQYHAAGSDTLSYGALAAPFARALEVDSAFLPALIHPIELTLLAGEREDFGRYLDRYERLGGEERGYGQLGTVVWGERPAAERALDALMAGGGSFEMLPAAVLVSRPELLDRVLDRLGAPEVTDPTSAGRRFFRALVALSGGRMQVFRRDVAALDAAGELGGPRAIFLRALAGLSGFGSADDVAAVLDDLTGPGGSGGQAVLQAMLAARIGDTLAARAYLASVPDVLDAAGRARYEATRAWVAWMEDPSDAALSRFREAVAALQPPGLGSPQIDNVLRFELAVSMSRSPTFAAEGLRRLRRGPDVRTAPEMYGAWTEALASALEEVGDRESARAAYARVAALWEGASPELEARLLEARRALERLGEAG